MAYTATLTIDDESFDLLSYHNLFFYPNPLDKKFNNHKDVKNPLEIYGTKRKYHCWRHDLLKDYDHPSLHCNSFKPYSDLIGGVFTFTIESTGKEDIFENCMSTRKDDRIPIYHGVLKFYDSSDEYMPFQQIEFWDGHVCHLSESFSSTGSKPMTMQVSISPATIRVNKSIVIQQCWWQKDIYAKGENAKDENEPFVKKVFWKGREQGQERKDIMLNHAIKLQVQLSDYAEGDTVELVVKQSNGRRIKGNNADFTVSGTCDDSGLIVLDDFTVECDFKEDSQNFGMIEFYHNERKVGDFKENFGWNYIKNGKVMEIYCNIELSINYLAPGCTENDYKDAVIGLFKRILEKSSDGLVSGKLFFDGIYVKDPPQVVPKLEINKTNENSSGTQTTGSLSLVESMIVDDSFLLTDIGEASIHELFHTLRLDHPFSITQANDSSLMNKGYNHYETTSNTDSNIYYNIMLST